MTHRLARITTGIVIAIAVGSGCQGDGLLPTAEVTGKLTLDGTPVGNAEIWLVPTDANTAVKEAQVTIRPYARTAADGTFTITSYLPDDGAPLGEYAVMVLKPGPSDNADDDDGADDPAPTKGRSRRGPAMPAKYGSPKLSGLTFTVQPGSNRLDLDLKSK